jgi:hypothetical protein
MKRAAIIIFIAILATVFGPLSYCQNAPRVQEAKTVRGQVSQIDWAASTVTVRWLQTEGYVCFDEITIFVPDGVHIIRGGKTIGLAELQIGSQVTVEYVNTSPGPLKLINMTVVTP